MRRRALALIVMASLTLVACSDAQEDPSTTASTVASIDDIVIGTSDGLAPTITMPADQTFTESDGKVVWEGDGAPLVDDQPLLLDVYGVSLADGSEIVNTFDGLPRPYVLASEVLGDEIYDLLIDARVGTRILVVAPAPGPALTSEATATTGAPDVALVVDVLSDRAVGTEVPARDDLPSVTLDAATGEPTITIEPGLSKPATVQFETLIQGTGQQVTSGSFIIMNYTAVRWDDGSEFSSSWDPGTAPFSAELGAGQLISALETALVDQPVGSQVLVVAPPEFGYPDEGTLVFVVDILDMWAPVE